MEYGVVPKCEVCNQDTKRRYSFYVEKSFVPHYNPSVGSFVSSQSEFNNKLRILGDEQTERTGILHNYVPVEVGDSQAFGLGGEDVEEFTRARFDNPRAPESIV